MKKISVNHLSMLCVLTALVAVPASASRTTIASVSKHSHVAMLRHVPRATALRNELVADGPGPTPWPKTPPTGERQPILLADGPGPTPWPTKPPTGLK
jgi:hypothetical protein